MRSLAPGEERYRVPGGGAISFVARLSKADFGGSAARVHSSGVITAAR